MNWMERVVFCVLGVIKSISLHSVCDFKRVSEHEHCIGIDDGFESVCKVELILEFAIGCVYIAFLLWNG